MAFVYKSDKILGKEIPYSELGPGQYLPQGVQRELKPAKVPFNSITNRDTASKKNENSIGPGSYEYDEKYENFANMIKDKSPKPYSNIRSLELNGSENLDPFTIIINKETNKDAAFLSKERRFKENNKTNDNPGPGFYQNHDPLFLVKNSIKIKNIKKKKQPEKTKLSLMRYDNNSGSPNRVITIPSKNISYGYDILPNGEVSLKEDPEKSFKFKGEYGDTVGPGSYETLPGKQWNKNMVSWDKLSKTSLDIIKDKNNHNNSIEKKISNNQNDSAFLDINKTCGINKNKNNLTSEKINTQDNLISTKMDVILAKEKQKEIKDKIFRQLKEKRQKLLDMKNYNSASEDDLLSKHVMHQDPGPGYYNVEAVSTAFRNKGLPEKFQYFGSNQIRFHERGFEDLGPGSYFKDDQRLEKIKLKKFLEEKVNFSANVALQKEELKTLRNSDSESRMGINGLVNKQKILADGNLPGPGWYETIGNNFLKKNVSNCEQFGSIQKRFSEQAYSETTPGPGSYIGLKKNQTTSISGNMYKLIRKNKKPNTDDEKERSLSPGELSIGNIRKSNEGKVDISKKKNDDKVKNFPAVGTYNSEIIHSLGYKIAKNINKYNNSIAPFSSMEKRFRNFNKKTAADHIAPGHYFKEKILQQGNNNSSPPFNTSVDRLNEKQIKNINNGPGTYNLNSYFDWNKKSYNIQYI